MALLLLHTVVVAAVCVVVNDDQLGLQGALKLPTSTAVVLRRLETHEDGCDWLRGLQGIEDGVRDVFSVDGRGRSVRGGGATAQRGGCSAVMAGTGWRGVAIKLFFVHADVIAERNVIGWSVTELTRAVKPGSLVM